MAREFDQDIIDICKECRDRCAEWLEVNNIQTSEQVKDDCSRLILECYDICAYTVITLERETPFSKEICQLCELICEACGNECNTGKDSSINSVAEICYETAERCRQRLY
ncbi:four-helix bundle copper-binding protein [Pseudalkalibacillus berkeleyi]|uniref:Four-helix bundle copper-binding protein n=1 Tax=Pseudalkalibacillus berkeleyi TaxID=1069813 RepID=A0ABS9H0J2_9BACL|nr:four-helix bundle copper-binding protein [Pseudalkalibacillus berkeleyi]MCF6137358.1 four-helix bundle copper-binding protein [Pseudalkalibacillus berkeleyi]